MDEEEFEDKQENANSTLRDIYEEFVEMDSEVTKPKKKVSKKLIRLSDKVLR